MVGVLFHLFTKRGGRYTRRDKSDLLGKNPLFYKVFTVDKNVYKIKRRRWN